MPPRGSGSSAGEGTGRSRRNYGSPAQSRLQQQIASAMGGGTTILSTRYLGRDKAGRPMYRVQVVPTAAYRRFGSASKNVRYQTVSFQGGKVYPPALKGSGVPTGKSSSKGQPTDKSAGLDAAKDQWYTTIAKSNHSPHHQAQLRAAVRNWNGSAAGLNQRMAQLFKPTWGPVVKDDPDVDEGGEPEFGFDFGGLFGGGGGGGGGGPEYVAPDRRVVEDMAKGMLVSLVGHVPEGQVKALADLYMKDHRRNFDSLDQEIDPAQSMLEKIRDTEEYRTTHALRPEEEDERSWISNRADLAKRGGLNQEDVGGFAVTQATVGGDEGDMMDAAAAHQFAQTGSARGTTLQDKMKMQATLLFQNVV